MLGEPLEPLVPDFVIEELRVLSKRRDKRGRNAELALSIASNLRPLETGLKVSADEGLVALASEKGYLIVTADSALQKRLRSLGRRCVYVSRRLSVHIWS